MSSGMDEIIGKPVDVDDLVKIVESLPFMQLNN
jgi:hypothetical protein